MRVPAPFGLRLPLTSTLSPTAEGITAMAAHARTFDRDKALEVIIYVAKNLASPSLHSISKILYLADKRHLQHFGRLICGDRYVAMEYGPVPSAVYNMMKVADGRESIDCLLYTS